MNNGTCFDIVWSTRLNAWTCHDTHPWLLLAVIVLLMVTQVGLLLTLLARTRQPTRLARSATLTLKAN